MKGDKKSAGYKVGQRNYEHIGPLSTVELYRLAGECDSKRKQYLFTVYGTMGGKYAMLIYESWARRNGSVDK